MRDVVIVEAVRSPIGSFGGVLASLSATELGVKTTEGLFEKTSVTKEMVEEVVIGNVLSAGKGMNVARQIAIGAGFPVTTPAYVVSNVCGSGLKAVLNAVQAVMTGDRDVVLAGGVESMSQSAYVLPEQRFGLRMGNGQVIDTLLNDGLTDAFSHHHMGITAENLAERFDISREEQDLFAIESQRRASAARQSNVFKDEIIPILVNRRKQEPLLVAQDEGIRERVCLEKLARLKPAFKENGSVTAGNSSSINDGAAMILLMSKEKAEELGINYLAVVKGYAFEGTDPDTMGYGPVVSTRKVLAKLNYEIADFDLIESNEAFAAQALTVAKELDFDMDMVNIYGGAIALGHPIGASGARILTTLLHGLKNKNLQRGLATLCVGGGMGVSIVVEREG